MPVSKHRAKHKGKVQAWRSEIALRRKKQKQQMEKLLEGLRAKTLEGLKNQEDNSEEE